MHTIIILFGWPDGIDGQVWPNVLAGILSATFVWLVGLRHLRRVHKAHQQAIAETFKDYLTERKSE